jgi:hypothetical protein
MISGTAVLFRALRYVPKNIMPRNKKYVWSCKVCDDERMFHNEKVMIGAEGNRSGKNN